jgi:hypothetical protein
MQRGPPDVPRDAKTNPRESAAALPLIRLEQHQNSFFKVAPNLHARSVHLEQVVFIGSFPLFAFQRKKKPFNAKFVLSSPPIQTHTIDNHATAPDNHPG